MIYLGKRNKSNGKKEGKLPVDFNVSDFPFGLKAGNDLSSPLGYEAYLLRQERNGILYFETVPVRSIGESGPGGAADE